MTGSIILGITFGMEVQPRDDPYVLLAEKALHTIAVAGNVGAYLGTFASSFQIYALLMSHVVDLFPICELIIYCDTSVHLKL